MARGLALEAAKGKFRGTVNSVKLSHHGAGATMGKAVFKLTSGDIIEAFQVMHLRAIRSWRGLLWLLLFTSVLIVILTFAMMGIGAPPMPVTALAVALTVLTMIGLYLMLNHQLVIPAPAQRFHASSKGYQGDIEASWNAKGMSMKSATSSTTAEWSDFVGWQETPRFLLLIPRPGHASFVLPKAALGSGGVSTVLAHLASHNVRRRAANA